MATKINPQTVKVAKPVVIRGLADLSGSTYSFVTRSLADKTKPSQLEKAIHYILHDLACSRDHARMIFGLEGFFSRVGGGFEMPEIVAPSLIDEIVIVNAEMVRSNDFNDEEKFNATRFLCSTEMESNGGTPMLEAVFKSLESMAETIDEFFEADNETGGNMLVVFSDGATGYSDFSKYCGKVKDLIEERPEIQIMLIGLNTDKKDYHPTTNELLTLEEIQRWYCKELGIPLDNYIAIGDVSQPGAFRKVANLVVSASRAVAGGGDIADGLAEAAKAEENQG